MPQNPEMQDIEELRKMWARAWGYQPPKHLGRAMLEKSLASKRRELNGEGLTPEQNKRLNQLVLSYKRNSKFFEHGLSSLKPGTRLVKVYKGESHSVFVHTDGFEYCGRKYKSLSEIATAITGTRWNGWVFFGLKRAGTKP